MNENRPTLRAFRKKNYSELAYESLKEYIVKYREQADEDDELKLPPEIELAKSMNISRATLRQVLTELETEGVIIRIHGKGTFISRNSQQLYPFVDCKGLIESRGYRAEWEILRAELAECPEDVRLELKLPEETKVREIDTVYYADGAPCMLIRDWVPVGPAAGPVDMDQLHDSFGKYVNEETGKVGSHEHTVVSAATTEAVKRMFGKPYFGSGAVIVLDSTVYTQENLPLCRTLSYCDPNYIQLQFFGKVMQS